jgi:hypothetical protein
MYLSCGVEVPSIAEFNFGVAEARAHVVVELGSAHTIGDACGAHLGLHLRIAGIG